jgi:hypothetical protein
MMAPTATKTATNFQRTTAPHNPALHFTTSYFPHLTAPHNTPQHATTRHAKPLHLASQHNIHFPLQ